MKYVLGFAWCGIRRVAEVIDQPIGLFQGIDGISLSIQSLEMEVLFAESIALLP